MWVVDADIDQETALVGESTTAEIHVKNSGDSGGALTVDIRANETTIATKRVQLDAKSEKHVDAKFSIDEPGTYKIKADEENAGTLTVTDIRVASSTDRDDGRTVLVRAGSVETGTSLTAEFPDAGDQSFALESVSMTGTSSGFNRSVATYSPPDRAPFTLPDDERSTVIGAIDMDSLPEVETTSLQIAIDRDAIRESGLQTDEVVVYERKDGKFSAVSTTQASTTSDAIIYEADANGSDQFVVGALAPEFKVRSTQLSTRSADPGQQINLTATVSNDGAVSGQYTGEMVVDGDVVAEQTVSIPAGERETVTFQHVVSERGDYEVALGNRSAGSVVITGDDVATEETTETDESTATDESGTESATESTATDDEEIEVDGGLSLPSLDDIGLQELGIGAGIVVLGGGLLLVLRR